MTELAVPRIADIQSAVAEAFGVTVDQLRGPSRDRRRAWPRQAAFLICRESGAHTYAAIGRRFGDRDHATVLYGVDAAQVRMAYVREFAAGVARARAILAEWGFRA